jgi:hypothetical protein
MNYLIALQAFYLRHKAGITGIYFLLALTAVGTMDNDDLQARRAARALESAQIKNARMHTSLCIHDPTSSYCKGEIK